MRDNLSCIMSVSMICHYVCISVGIMFIHNVCRYTNRHNVWWFVLHYVCIYDLPLCLYFSCHCVQNNSWWESLGENKKLHIIPVLMLQWNIIPLAFHDTHLKRMGWAHSSECSSYYEEPPPHTHACAHPHVHIFNMKVPQPFSLSNLQKNDVLIISVALKLSKQGYSAYRYACMCACARTHARTHIFNMKVSWPFSSSNLQKIDV